MVVHTPDPDSLRKILVTILAGATGKPDAYWQTRLGELVRVDLTRSPITNWS